LHVCSPVSAPRFLVTRTWRGRPKERGPSPEGNAQHGSEANGAGSGVDGTRGPANDRVRLREGRARMDEQPAAERHEKYFRTPRRLVLFREVRLRATDTPAMGIRSRLCGRQVYDLAYVFTSPHARHVRRLSGVIRKATVYVVCRKGEKGLRLRLSTSTRKPSGRRQACGDERLINGCPSSGSATMEETVSYAARSVRHSATLICRGFARPSSGYADRKKPMSDNAKPRVPCHAAPG